MMKDKSLLIIIIGIVVIVGLGLWEQIYLGKISKEKYGEIDDVHNLVVSGNVENGKKVFKDIVKRWEKDRKILEMMINHDDIKKITMTLKEIEDNFENFFDIRDISANFAVLKEYIINMDRENKFTLTNVL